MHSSLLRVQFLAVLYAVVLPSFYYVLTLKTYSNGGDIIVVSDKITNS